MPGAQTVGAHQMATDLQAFAAKDQPVDFEVLGHHGRTFATQSLPARHRPADAQVAAARQGAVHLNTPRRDQMAPGPQRAERAQARAGVQVLANIDHVAGANAAAGVQRAAGANNRVNIDFATHLDRARIDEGFRRDGIDHENGIDRSELIQQPAGVVDASVSDEGVDHALVLGRALEAPGKPAVAAGTGALGPERG